MFLKILVLKIKLILLLQPLSWEIGNLSSSFYLLLITSHIIIVHLGESIILSNAANFRPGQRSKVFLRRERKEIMPYCTIALNESKFGGNKLQLRELSKICQESSQKYSKSLKYYSITISNSKIKFLATLPVSLEAGTTRLLSYF